jgi:hypothetical protein
MPNILTTAYLVKIDDEYIVKAKFTYCYPHLLDSIL